MRALSTKRSISLLSLLLLTLPYLMGEAQSSVTLCQDCKPHPYINNKDQPSNGWRGITPLHFTRDEVERALGKHQRSIGSQSIYESQCEIVNVLFSKGSCELSGVELWKVPKDTVIWLEVAPATKLFVKDLTCRIVTDEFPRYRPILKDFEGGHEVVRHSVGEYVKPGTDIHSNSVEGVFSLLKRGVMGTFHSVSKKHLPNYLNEFEFRFNTRKANDGERVIAAIKASDGKRLMYRESVDNPPYLVGN